MNEEEQEALSHRYVDAARVVRLETGRFAVFTMASGGILGIVAKEELAELVEKACAMSYESYITARKIEQTPQSPHPTVSAKPGRTISLEELFGTPSPKPTL